MSKLPNAENAFIDKRKFEEYCLNPEHPRGQHKARVFRAALGLSRENFRVLVEAILENVLHETAILTFESDFGWHYRVDFPVTVENRTAMVRTTWIVRFDENFPRMVSCFVIK